MAEASRFTPEELTRQVRQHLDCLRSAGVEWLPNLPLPEQQPGPETVTQQPLAAPKLALPDGRGSADQEESSSMFEHLEKPAPLSHDQRRHELTLLAEKVSACHRCPELVASRTKTVFGVGPLDVELCFVGEAPGGEEDAQGEPFVGPAGQLLNRIIAACKLKREEVYICNVIKCRPPGNRTPLPNETANCRGYLEKQLELARPKFICALGGVAVTNLLGTTQSISRLRGRFHDYRGIPVMCTYHPAYLLPHRSPEKKKEVWEDMKMLMARMGRPVK